MRKRRLKQLMILLLAMCMVMTLSPVQAIANYESPALNTSKVMFAGNEWFVLNNSGSSMTLFGGYDSSGRNTFGRSYWRDGSTIQGGSYQYYYPGTGSYNNDPNETNHGNYYVSHSGGMSDPRDYAGSDIQKHIDTTWNKVSQRVRDLASYPELLSQGEVENLPANIRQNQSDIGTFWTKTPADGTAHNQHNSSQFMYVNSCTLNTEDPSLRTKIAAVVGVGNVRVKTRVNTSNLLFLIPVASNYSQLAMRDSSISLTIPEQTVTATGKNPSIKYSGATTDAYTYFYCMLTQGNVTKYYFSNFRAASQADGSVTIPIKSNYVLDGEYTLKLFTAQSSSSVLFCSQPTEMKLTVAGDVSTISVPSPTVTPPGDGGITTPPDGDTTPPDDGGSTTPPSDGGSTTPPSNGGTTNPPATVPTPTPAPTPTPTPPDNGSTTPPGNGGTTNPPTTNPTPTPIPTPTQPEIVKVKSVKTLPTLNLVKGRSITLPASVQPYDAKDKTVTWKSSSKNVTVNAATGKVKAVKAGKATLTVTTNDGKKKAKCIGRVVAKTTKVKTLIAQKPIGLTVGKTTQIKVKTTPAKATGIVPKFSSSKKAVATIDRAGVITAKKLGTSVITIKAGGKTQKVTVTVGKILPTKVTLNKKSISVKAKSTYKLTAKLAPAKASPKTIKWISSNKRVATVDKNGKVKGIKKGKATITATTWNGKSVKCTVIVR